jgi:hypothetical protein
MENENIAPDQHLSDEEYFEICPPIPPPPKTLFTDYYSEMEEDLNRYYFYDQIMEEYIEERDQWY